MQPHNTGTLQHAADCVHHSSDVTYCFHCLTAGFLYQQIRQQPAGSVKVGAEPSRDVSTVGPHCVYVLATSCVVLCLLPGWVGKIPG